MQLKQQNQSVSHMKSEWDVKAQEGQQRADLLDNEVKVLMKEMVKER